MIAASLTFATLVATVLGHARVTIPQPRLAGDYQLEVCGEAVTKKLKSDLAGPIENSVAKIDDDWTPACNLYLCKGYQWEDNTDNVNAYSAGDVITFHIDLVAAHKPGWANVSIIDLATNTAIGSPVKSWDVWPDDVSGGGDDVDFNVTIPSTLGSACDEGGKCALQWFWWSNSNSQTYENCVDFYVD